MIRPLNAILVGLLVLSTMPGCGEVRSALGMGGKKQGPDEFMVMSSRQGLAVPPNVGLRPPQPGAPPRNDAIAADEAKRAVLGQDNTGRVQGDRPGFERMSDGEANLLKQAGALGADPNIRYIVDRETVGLVEANKTIVEEILFWRPPARPEQLVDAGKEAERLKQNAEDGKTATAGDTPTISRKRRGVLDGIFN